MRQVRGVVAGPWAEEKVLIRCEDGEAFELPAPEEIRSYLDGGDDVMVYFDEEGRVAGWKLAGLDVGVDVRRMDADGG